MPVIVRIKHAVPVISVAYKDQPPRSLGSMAHDNHLPAYARTAENVPSPSYSPPARYAIGKHRLAQSLVSLEDVKTHLALLAAFYGLQQKVEAGHPGFPGLANEMSAEQRWGWFVALAVER